uniref:Uncharacterized protein n=1 Tax=Arundo donax TaxID=35708 RepID=A0A0A9A373_ARUDO
MLPFLPIPILQSNWMLITIQNVLDVISDDVAKYPRNVSLILLATLSCATF